MDTRTTQTLEGQTVQTISEIYFGSLNDGNKKLHLVQDNHASLEEIKTDARVWYAGFMGCAKLLGFNPAELPPLESVLGTITKNFADKAKIAA